MKRPTIGHALGAHRALAVLALVVSGTGPAVANYPIFSQRYAADPTPLVSGGRVYVFSSHDLDGQTWWDMRDFTCISSDDLVNWTDHGEVFDSPRDTVWATYAWAPMVVERGGGHYLYYTNARDGTGVAVSADGPLGPYVDPLGAPLVDSGTFSDPTVLVDDDGVAYLQVNAGSWARLNPDMVSLQAPLSGYPASAFPDYKEGGILHKINGRYNLAYSTPNLTGYGWTYAQSVSDSPTGGFVPHGRWFWMSSDNEPNTQGDFFPFAGRWYMVYHNAAVARSRGIPSIFQRSLAVDRIYFNPDGSIRYLTSTRDGMPQVKYVDPYVRNEAETVASEESIETEPSSAGGRDVTAIQDGDWIRVQGVDFGHGADQFTAAVASVAAGGSIQIRLDAPAGRQVGACPVPATGGWQTWSVVTCPVANAAGVRDLYLRFTGPPGDLLNFDWWRFYGGPPAGREPPSALTRVVCMTPGPSDTYLRIDNEDGTWSFRSLSDLRYLALLGTPDEAIGWTDTNDASARFVLVSNPDRTWCLRAANGKFVVLEPGGGLNASHDEGILGSPRLLPDGRAIFAIDDCALDAVPACDLNAVDLGPGPPLPLAAVFGSHCGRVDPTLPAGRVAIVRPGVLSGARFDTAAAGAAGTTSYYQLDCGCSAVLKLVKDLTADRLAVE